MIIQRELEVAAGADRVWQILGPSFGQADHWASSVHASAPVGERFGDAPCVGRQCQTSLGVFKETITEYDKQNLRLTYEAEGEKMPFFVKELSNHWAVKPLAGNRSRLTMKLEAQLSFPFNWLMGWMMSRQLGGVASQAAKELKYYAEHGRPHPQKVKAKEKGPHLAAA